MEEGGGGADADGVVVVAVAEAALVDVLPALFINDDGITEPGGATPSMSSLLSVDFIFLYCSFNAPPTSPAEPLLTATLVVVVVVS